MGLDISISNVEDFPMTLENFMVKNAGKIPVFASGTPERVSIKSTGKSSSVGI